MCLFWAREQSKYAKGVTPSPIPICLHLWLFTLVALTEHKTHVSVIYLNVMRNPQKRIFFVYSNLSCWFAEDHQK